MPAMHAGLKICVNDLGSPYGVVCLECGSAFNLSQIPGVTLSDLDEHCDDASFFEDKLGIAPGS